MALNNLKRVDMPLNKETKPKCLQISYMCVCVCVFMYKQDLTFLVVECLPIGQETGVQSQVESYQRLKKWYLIPPYLTLSIIRYILRVKWSNPGKGVVPSPTPWCSSY